MTTLYQDIVATCTPQEIAEKNYHVIAAKVSAVRKVPSNRQIGYGDVLETIGVTSGNNFLDAVTSTTMLKYVRPMLDRGGLNASSPLVVPLLNNFVLAGVITREEADALIDLGFIRSAVTWQDCQAAIEAEE